MTMRLRVIQLLTVVLAAGAGAVIGMAWQHSRTGFHSSRIDEKEWPFDFGTLRLEHVYETVGTPFLQPAKSRLTLQPDDGQPIVLFEGQPVFQEKHPIVTDMAIDGHVLRFTDGMRSYSLRIERESRERAEREP